MWFEGYLWAFSGKEVCLVGSPSTDLDGREVPGGGVLYLFTACQLFSHGLSFWVIAQIVLSNSHFPYWSVGKRQSPNSEYSRTLFSRVYFSGWVNRQYFSTVMKACIMWCLVELNIDLYIYSAAFQSAYTHFQFFPSYIPCCLVSHSPPQPIHFHVSKSYSFLKVQLNCHSLPERLQHP